MKPEGLTFALRKNSSFIARTLIEPWSSPMASLYFKKSSIGFLHVLKQFRGLSWFGFPQKQALRLGLECKDFIWEMIPGVPLGGGE